MYACKSAFDRYSRVLSGHPIMPPLPLEFSSPKALMDTHGRRMSASAKHGLVYPGVGHKAIESDSSVVLTMNRQPGDPNSFDNRQELIRQQEVLRLQQEERRLKAAQRRSRLAWIRNAIFLLVGALEILLALRFFLRVSLANLENAFAQLIFNLSDPFVAPFATLFISPTNADATRIFDLNILVAMVIYGLLGVLGVALVNFLAGQD